MLKNMSTFICKYADILIFSLIGFVLTCLTTLDLLFPETVFFKCLFFIAAALLLQHLLPRPFIGKILTVPLAVGSLYIFPVPIIACRTGQILTCHHDVFFGMYLTLLLGNLRELLIPAKESGAGKVFFLLFSALCLFLTLPALADIIHYCMYGINISEASVFAVLDTDLRESLEYVSAYFPFGTVLLFLTAAAGTAALLCFIDYKLPLCSPLYSGPRRRGVYIGLCLTVLAAFMYSSLLPKTMLMKMYRSVKEFRAASERFRDNNSKIAADIRLTGADSLGLTEPSTIIMVIGESACRDYMKVYTPDFPYDDTPWLSGMKTDPDFLIFNNVYACNTQTVPCLTQALTEAGQYNKKSYADSATVLNAAKKLGYTTYWFTKQGRTGINDANVTMIAETADRMYGRSGGDVGYDHELLSQFKATRFVQRSFIVFHLMGSHIDFSNRYPKAYERFQGDRSAEYANTILYTDEFLRKVYEYAKNSLNLRVMLYFSDHGEDFGAERHPDVFNMHTVRIPFFIYFSPEYQRENPDKFRRLCLNKDKYFTNDMLYNTLCGILSAYSNHYDQSEDISSSAYGYGRRNVRSLGRPIRFF